MAAMAVEEKLRLGSKQNLGVSPRMLFFPIHEHQTNLYVTPNPNPTSPGLLNSLAGLLSTLASIYGAQHGQFSSTSKVTLILTGLSTVIFAVLTVFYMFWLVRRVKQRHDREIGMQRAGKRGEGMVDFSTRKQPG